MPFFLRTFFSSSNSALLLLRQVLLFAAVDVVYLSFSTAYAFAHYGTQGALLYLAAQYVVSAGGFVGCFVVMHGGSLTPLRGLRLGIAGMLLGMGAAGAYASPMGGLCGLVLAGGSRGVAWASRQWLEIHHTRGRDRETYVGLLQTASTVFKTVGPLLAASLLYFSHESFRVMFLALAGCGLTAVVLVRSTDDLPTPRPGVARPLQTLFSRQYWETAPFYVLEGAGNSLRQALFVSGTLMVVGTVSRFGLVDTLASVGAAGFLAWQAGKGQLEPSLARLRFSLTLVGLSWLILLLALNSPWLLPLFVAAYAFGNPLLQTVKASLVLKGLSSAGVAAHDAAMSREILLVSARLVALLLAAALTQASESRVTGLAAVTTLALMLLPLEYVFAKALAQRVG